MLNAALADFRARLEPAAQAEYNQVFGTLASFYADARIAGIPSKIQTRFGEEETADCPASKVWSFLNYKQYQVRRTGQRDPAYDFDCDLSIYPGSPWTFVILISEPSRGYDEVWEATPGVEKYSYWDNTDPPEGWTYERWSRIRGGQWHRRLDTKPLVWSLYHEYGGAMPPQGDDLVNTQPTHTERVERLAKSVVQKRVPGEIIELVKSNKFGWLQAYDEWLKSAEYQLLMATEVDRLSTILPERLTLDDLLGKSAICVEVAGVPS
jgi:hypothetical protein